MKTKLGKGAVEVNKDALRTLVSGDMAAAVEVIQIANESLVEAGAELSKKTTLSIGSPATIRIDLKKLGSLKQVEVREILEKLADMQHRLAEEEASKINKLLR